MKYYTKVNDQEFIIEIDHDDEIVVNGERFAIDFQSLPAANIYSLLIDNSSLEGLAEERDDTWEVLIRGELYTVRVQDERAYRLAQARGTAAAVTGEAVVKSPMPGIIVSVPVSEGDLVQKGDKVVILESMKMENELHAPRDGVIGRVLVEPGASVEKGQSLVVVTDPEEETGG
ncbi:MAG: biotin/lipoyl-containing protein [Anaerolineae bacterium]